MTLYFIIGSGVLVAIIALLSFRRGLSPRSRPLAAVAMIFVVAGLVFGRNRVVGFSLIGVGIALAIMDIIRRKPPARPEEPSAP